MNEKATELQKIPKPSEEDIREFQAEKTCFEKKQSGSYPSTSPF